MDAGPLKKKASNGPNEPPLEVDLSSTPLGISGWAGLDPVDLVMNPPVEVNLSSTPSLGISGWVGFGPPWI